MNTSSTVQQVQFHRKKIINNTKESLRLKMGFGTRRVFLPLLLLLYTRSRREPNKIEFSTNICSSNDYIFDNLGGTFLQKKKIIDNTKESLRLKMGFGTRRAVLPSPLLPCTRSRRQTRGQMVWKGLTIKRKHLLQAEH